jgi:hypothetical protein
MKLRFWKRDKLEGPPEQPEYGPGHPLWEADRATERLFDLSYQARQLTRRHTSIANMLLGAGERIGEPIDQENNHARS